MRNKDFVYTAVSSIQFSKNAKVVLERTDERSDAPIRWLVLRRRKGMSVMQVQDFCDERKEHGSVRSLAGVEGPGTESLR